MFSFWRNPISIIKNNLVKVVSILVVSDDDLINRTVIDSLLRKLGFTVILAENGHQALDLILKGNKFDLILMDLQMPIMDGRVTTEQIRKWEMEQNLPRNRIYAFIADAIVETQKKCIGFEMDGVITKPFKIEDIIAIINEETPDAFEETPFAKVS